MDTTLKLKPRPTNVALIAWQFTGQPLHEWPSWVQEADMASKTPGEFTMADLLRFVGDISPIDGISTV